jgi:hypothetical protein
LKGFSWQSSQTVLSLNKKSLYDVDICPQAENNVFENEPKCENFSLACRTQSTSISGDLEVAPNGTLDYPASLLDGHAEQLRQQSFRHAAHLPAFGDRRAQGTIESANT